MNIKNYKILKNSTILSLPGLFSIFLSLISIPIHLNIAGTESYGNYIIFHFILVLSIIFNFGIGKSIAVSISNYPKKNKEISYQGIKYTCFISGILITVFYLFSSVSEFLFISNLLPSSYLNFIAYGFAISIIYSSLEGIFQGNHKFKSLSFYNFIFYSLSISLPSISLLYFENYSLKNLIIFSLIIKSLSIVIMLMAITNNNLITKSNNKILLLNLKNNSKWLTLSSLLIHFYDLFDKYLVKIFLGPIAIATYSIPQQLTGKLSILSKGFSAFLLPNLSKKKGDAHNFNFTIKIFLKLIPFLILLLFPFFDIFLNFWLKNNYNETILILTKIFSICSIFSCISHLLITKFEASKTLYRNLKVEFFLMPLFLTLLYFLTSNSFSLVQISILILLKEWILLILRLFLLRKDIKNLKNYYIYSLLLLIGLYLSISFEQLFFIFVMLLTLSFFLKNDF